MVGHHLPHFPFSKFSTMSRNFTLNVLERCKVTPPPNTTPTSSSLPLTFLDLPWLFFSPNQPLFFYEFPHPISHFTTTTLPKLKHSLSLTLQHYYPFAGHLFVPSSSPELTKPQLVFTHTDSVSLTIAESSGDFGHLCSNLPREVNDFHPLVPKLGSISNCGKALLAIQITVFPNAGICIGLAFHNVVSDGRTFESFFKTWASYFTLETSSLFPLTPLPFYDRSVIVDSKNLEEIFLKEWQKRRLVHNIAIGGGGEITKLDLSNMVRATFVMGPNEMEKIRRFIVDFCEKKNESRPVHLSAYVLTCAFLWVCLVKTQKECVDGEVIEEDDPIYFGFVAGGLPRLEFRVPVTYLGNCVGFGRASVRRKELLGGEDHGNNGIVVAARAIGGTIRKLDGSIFEEAEKWVTDWEVLLNGSGHNVHVTWSPKLKLYDESDFGWGRPKKIEEISIDSTKGVSLVQSRDVEGGIEIGLALPNSQMDAFSILFTKGLDALS